MDKLSELWKAAEDNLSCSAHSIDHVKRVYTLALRLSEGEEIDLNVVKAAAILHDIGGPKESGNTDHAIEGAKMAEPILRRLGYPEDKIKHIQDCIITHRFRTDNKPKTMEAKIIFDADKLDTVGAIGVARSFAWVGKHNAQLYRKSDLREYAEENLGGKLNGRIQDKTKHSAQINFEIKDKHILKFLHTKKAKEIAKDRLAFSIMFFERMEKEINNES